MKALIFAAGIGSRLKPWTDRHPKALVEVGGSPMLGSVINKLIDAGINDIIINVHHFADQIRAYVSQSHFKANITFSDETDLLLETGGGLRKVVDRLNGEPVLVHNADIFTDFSIQEMISAHKSARVDVTLLTADRKTSRYFVFDKNEMLRGWTNVSTGQLRPDGFVIEPDYTLRAFNGVHIIEPSGYELLNDFRPAGVPFSIVDFYIACCDRLAVRSFNLPDGSAWFDIGKPETLEKAREYANNKNH